MALDIQITVQNNVDSMVLIDSTGNYDAVSNPGGWGAPNPTRGTVSGASVVITPPGAEDLASINLGTFLNTELSYDITSAVEALDTTLTDGIWKYVFTFSGSGIPDPTVYALRTNTVRARLISLSMKNLDKVSFSTLKEVYDKMLYAFEAEEYVLAEELMVDLNSLLEECVGSDFGSGC
ncbi:MAG: hypothetical protein ACK5DE_10180 [Bacteroidota bacterium]|jgi:hypothetical protein